MSLTLIWILYNCSSYPLNYSNETSLLEADIKLDLEAGVGSLLLVICFNFYAFLSIFEDTSTLEIGIDFDNPSFLSSKAFYGS